MNTASAIRLRVAVGAATTVTALSPFVVANPIEAHSMPSANVRPYTATIPGSSITAFYDVLTRVELDIDQLAAKPQFNRFEDELDLTDVYVDLDAHLPPRNAGRWRPIEVTVVRAERRRGTYTTDDDKTWQ
jgi:hypothetical protein